MKDCAPDAAADISVKMTKMIMNDKSNNALLENRLLADSAQVWTFDNTVFDFVLYHTHYSGLQGHVFQIELKVIWWNIIHPQLKSIIYQFPS